MLWDQARVAHMDIALDIKSTACRLTSGPSEKRLIIERGIVFTGLSWAKMVKKCNQVLQLDMNRLLIEISKYVLVVVSYLINRKL